MRNFTSNDLLLYITKEIPNEQGIPIERVIHSDKTLSNELFLLQQTLSDLEHFSVSPSDRIMENILTKLRDEKSIETV